MERKEVLSGLKFMLPFSNVMEFLRLKAESSK